MHSDRMRCDFFVANNRMRFTHASKKINATHVIQLDHSDSVRKNACDFTHASKIEHAPILTQSHNASVRQKLCKPIIN